MPRERDKRIRLRRLERGYLIAPPSIPKNTCNCGSPKCPLLKLGSYQGYKSRHGSWETVDGRFEIRWEASNGHATNSYRDGCVLLIDRKPGQWEPEWRYCYSLREAKKAILLRLAGKGWTDTDNRPDRKV